MGIEGSLSEGSHDGYLLADQPSELELLQLQSRVWEVSGRALLTKVGDGSGLRALDVGCGALGWVRILSEWAGPSGQVVGTDIDERLLDASRSFVEASEDELAALRRQAEGELAEPGRCGTTFTVIQSRGRRP